jgi:RNA polymerase sigma factor (sigma-70 family)
VVQSPEEYLLLEERWQAWEAVLDYLESLNPRLSKCVYLHFTQNLSQREIAEGLGISAQSVSRYLRSFPSRVRKGLWRGKIDDFSYQDLRCLI